MKIIKTIARGMAGIQQTCREMINLAEAGKTYPAFRRLAYIVPTATTDAFLRSVWNYKPDGPVETLTTIERMTDHYYTTGQFIGDCDEAATIAAAFMLLGPPCVRSASVVAVRQPSLTWEDQSHVFVTAILHDRTTIRIDPTAPLDADYTNWEPLSLRIL